jgi:hypothetical protein
MNYASRQWIAPVGLLCLSLPIFGLTAFTHAAQIFASFLVFVTICVWAYSRN